MSETVVISPHSDDAAISLGSLLYHIYLPCSILVPFNRSLENMLGIDNEVTELRKKEDKVIADKYGFKFIYGNFLDTSLRGVPWDEKRTKVDVDLLREVSGWIMKNLPKDFGRIFYPAACGEHPDHIICNLSIAQSHEVLRKNSAMYMEQPYYLECPPIMCSLVEVEFCTSFKREMLSAYSSQITKERLDILAGKITKEYYFLWGNSCRV